MSKIVAGHSLSVLNGNIDMLVNEGTDEAKARGIAFRQARKSLRGKMETDGVEVFRAGNYPGKRSVSTDEVQQIADRYNNDQAGSTRTEAAIKQTHERNREAMGWVKSLANNGGRMVARFRNLSDTVLDGIIKESFVNPSIELRERDGELSLRSVALLGADPPAVAVPAFSEDDEAILLSLTEWQETTKGGDMPETHDVNITVKAEALEANPTTEVTTFSEADMQTAIDKAATEARETAKVEFAETQAKEAAKLHRNDAKAFCDELIKAKKLKPADKPFLFELLNAISPGLEFGEEDEKKSLYSELKARMTTAKESALFTEVTPKGDEGTPKDPDYNETPDVREGKGQSGQRVYVSGEKADAVIKKHMVDHKCDYEEASLATNFGEKEVK